MTQGCLRYCFYYTLFQSFRRYAAVLIFCVVFTSCAATRLAALTRLAYRSDVGGLKPLRFSEGIQPTQGALALSMC
jgi:hypothetical protein